MFKIIDYRNSSGKIFITIETDDFTSALMLRFLIEADKFAEIFHYRKTIESRLTASQKNKPEKMARARESRADLLKRYREIPGSRPQRLKILKDMFSGEGIEITLDRLAAKLKIATEGEILHNIALVKKLKIKGKTFSEIASTLSIPKSTVARYAKAKITEKRSMLSLVEPSGETKRKRHGEKSQ